MSRLGPRSTAVALAVSIVAAACGQSGDGKVTRSSTPADTGFAVAGVAREAPSGDADLGPLIDADLAFGLDLYREVAVDEDGNVFLSPYSVAVALAMTLAGARGDTASQMRDVLHLSFPDDELHAARNALYQTLDAPRSAREGTEPLQLDLTNHLWVQHDFEILDGYLNLLARHYGTGVGLVDFVDDPAGAVAAINEAVADATEERIDELLDENVIDELTRAVLVNTIFFLGSWVTPFEPARTEPVAFHRLDGTTVEADTMHNDLVTGYGSGDGWEAVRLAYEGDASMVIVTPDDGRFAQVEAALSPQLVHEVRESMGEARIDLAMPRFEFRSHFELPEVLDALGMVDAFVPPRGDSGADLTGIHEERILYVQDVIHEAFVSVDEEGTEAAAATAVVIGEESAPPRVDLDRPFLFWIEDEATGAVLFLGRVLDPTAS